MFLYRTKFAKEILTEFTPPTRKLKKQKVIIYCDGMPSNPRKQGLCKQLAKKGYWVFYPRYRGSWESGGSFLAESPARDISDIIDGLYKPFKEAAFGKTFSFIPDEIYVIGGSFGGCTALMSSLDPRVKKVIANCPVVDWTVQKKTEKAETSNSSYASYLREAWGNGYRLNPKNYSKLYKGNFFNPMHHVKEMDGNRIMIFHAKDDPYIPYKSVVKFAKKSKSNLKLLARGGHLGTDWVINKYWKRIKTFLDS
jgi:dipeptidyl aminopeptidase/acylaminoacyl peptidase